MSEPTRAAVRAANILRNTIRVGIPTRPELDRLQGEIIDRETGLPELLAAVEWVLDESTNATGVSCEAWGELQAAWERTKGIGNV